jgi:type II secretory pathway pseudopilin PulG
MIVIAIIGILAAVAIPNFMAARDRARVAAAISNLGALRTALEMYMVDNDIYPRGNTNAFEDTLMDLLEPYLESPTQTLTAFYDENGEPGLGYDADAGDKVDDIQGETGVHQVGYNGDETAYTIWVCARDRRNPNRTVLKAIQTGGLSGIWKCDPDVDKDPGTNNPIWKRIK